MSKRTNEINRITGTIISVSVKLIIYALVALLIYQGVIKGFSFGYEVFHTQAVAAAPGVDKVVTLKNDSSIDTANILKKNGLITNEYIFMIQTQFYDFEIHPGTYTLNTSMTSRDMLELFDEVPKDKDTES